MDQEASTSTSAPKRPRLETGGEANNGKCVCDYTNCSVEGLIVDLLSFFSYESNWNFENIERAFIPRMLAYSEIFQGGKIADFSKIRNVSLPQAKLLMRIFRNCHELIIDHMLPPRIQLSYITSCRLLEKLTITLADSDNFERCNDYLTIKKLKINAKINSFEFDPIAQILITTPHLQKISIDGGLLTMRSLNQLKFFNINSIKLKNTRFDQRSKNEFILLLRKNVNVNSLKLILTDSYFKNEYFYEIIYNFFREFPTQYYPLQYLTFTLCQYSEQKLSNLLNFPNLRVIKIYYSFQYSTKNFNNLINTLVQMGNTEIIFVEYFVSSHENRINTIEYVNSLTLQSTGVKMLLLNSVIGHRIQIETCNDYKPKLIK